MAPDVTKPRYPKRKRAEVNYEIDLSIDGDLDLEDDRNVSEELGEDVPAPASAANPANARQPDPIVEVDSEFEDATFGSRKVKKVGDFLRPDPHALLTSNSARSSRGPRRSSFPSSSRSDSCKPIPHSSDALAFCALRLGCLPSRIRPHSLASTTICPPLTGAQGPASRASHEGLRGSPCRSPWRQHTNVFGQVGERSRPRLHQRRRHAFLDPQPQLLRPRQMDQAC